MLRLTQEIDYKDVFKIHSQGQERSGFRGTVGWLLPPFFEKSSEERILGFQNEFWNLPQSLLSEVVKKRPRLNRLSYGK